MVTFEWDNQTFEVNEPEFGDSNIIEYTRIARQSRGNDTIIVRDAQWPEIETFGMTFIITSQDEADRFRRLIRETLGRFLDYTHIDGLTYGALILNPDTAIKQTGRFRYEVSLKLEVTEP